VPAALRGGREEPVSEQNVEVVKRGLEAFLRGDLDAAAAVLDPEVTYTWVEPGPWDCHNADDVIRLARQRHQEGLVGPVREWIDAGDHVVVRMENPNAELYGAARGETATTVVFTIEDGRIVRMRDFRSREEALAAVDAVDAG
jgi:ketosteroid isomerase-like protein